MKKYVRTKDGRIAEIKENMVEKVCVDAIRLVYKKEPNICVLNGDDGILEIWYGYNSGKGYGLSQPLSNYGKGFALAKEELENEINLH